MIIANENGPAAGKVFSDRAVFGVGGLDEVLGAGRGFLERLLLVLEGDA